MYVRVDAVPGSKKERVTKIAKNKYKIEVKEPAERNLANKRIHEVLSAIFEIPKTQISMLTGHRSRSKMYSIEKKPISS